jgi:hypothetical protein
LKTGGELLEYSGTIPEYFPNWRRKIKQNSRRQFGGGQHQNIPKLGG